MPSKLKCLACNGDGEQLRDGGTDYGDLILCSVCNGTGEAPKLDPALEAKNAKTVIARMSGQEPCYDVSVVLSGTNGAKAYIFLGTVAVLSKDELAKECQRQWPVQYKRGLKLRLRNRPTATP